MYGKKYIVDGVKAPHPSFKVTPIKQMRIESSEEISSWAGVKLGYPSFWFMPSVCYYVVLVKVGKWENGKMGRAALGGGVRGYTWNLGILKKGYVSKTSNPS